MVANRREVAGQILGRRKAVLGIFGKATLDDPAKGRRNARVEHGDRLGLLADDRASASRAQIRDGRRAGLSPSRTESHRTRTGPIGNRPTPPTPARATCTRRSPRPSQAPSPPRRSAPAPPTASVFRLHQFRQTEVQDLDETVARHHHVLGLQVAVDNPGGVRLCEPVGHLHTDLEEPP